MALLSPTRQIQGGDLDQTKTASFQILPNSLFINDHTMRSYLSIELGGAEGFPVATLKISSKFCVQIR
jgi:hypothetical protein